MKIFEQIGFSTILFDSLFGLILFFGLDSFLDIKGIMPFILYLFSTIILVHWWLIFKSADDAFDEEVTDSAVDLVFGLIYVILIEYIILMSRDFNLTGVTGYLLALLIVDMFWAIIWRYVGSWNTKDKKKIKTMETELDHNITINFISISFMAVLLLIYPYISVPLYLALFVIFYSIYIILSFRSKIIDLRIF